MSDMRPSWSSKYQPTSSPMMSWHFSSTANPGGARSADTCARMIERVCAVLPSMCFSIIGTFPCCSSASIDPDRSVASKSSPFTLAAAAIRS